jgi:hypothetical protein
MRRLAFPLLVLLTVAGACGSNDKTACDPAAQTGCASGQACELVENGSPACFDPVVLRGKVTNLATGAAIAGARLVGPDANRAPAGTVATSTADGTYALGVAGRRKADGTPSGSVTLRADARGFQSFPAGVRIALPIDLTSAVHANGAWTIQSSLTDVGLIALPAGAGTGSIQGVAAIPPNHAGVLVVAETGSSGTSAIADRSGGFAIFNLKEGAYTVKAYARGQNYTPTAVPLAAGQDAQTSLGIAGTATANVSGSVQIVNPGQGSATSVILIVESTFDPILVRGDAVPGLRAPDPGTDPNVTNAFSISGVPDGNYIALAAFENDFLVRDASDIGGTAISHVTVANGVANASPSFKVTGALDVVSPGASGPEQVTSAAPIFTWVDDSSEKSYDVLVFDAFGAVIWQTRIPPVTGSATASVTYGQAGGTPATAPALQNGLYYQFRAISRDAGGSALSQTEDLKGVFYLP